MIGKANELLQELFEKLKGRWYRQGKYAGEKFDTEDVKKLLKEILKEYEN